MADKAEATKPLPRWKLRLPGLNRDWFVSGQTKGEARAYGKLLLGIGRKGRLPVGATLVRVTP